MLLNKEVCNLLGLATRARQVVTGESVLNAIRKNTAKLVLYANDASENTKKAIRNKSEYYEIEAIEVENSTILSQAIGKQGRVALAVMNDGFAKKIKEKLGVGDKDGKDE